MIVIRIKMCDLAKSIAKLMYIFQIENDIKGKCVANTYYFNQALKDIGYPIEPKAKAVIAVYPRDAGLVMHVHMITYLGGDDAVDTSYEVKQHEPRYFDKIHLIKMPEGHEEFKKKLITDFIKLIELENKLNNNCKVCDMEYIEKQHNFVSESLDIINSIKPFVSKNSM